MPEPYTYNATITEVHDGDTLHAVVDLGFGVQMHGTERTIDGLVFRLAGCNAAELGTPGGDAAAANLKTMLPVGTPVTLTSIQTDKYDRWDAVIYLQDGTDLIAELIAQQWLAPWDGVGNKNDFVPPWPRTVP